jgi:hypothetical protein
MSLHACPAVEELPRPVAKTRGKGKTAAAAKSKDPELAKLERQKTALQKAARRARSPSAPKSCANSRSRACPPFSSAASIPIPPSRHSRHGARRFQFQGASTVRRTASRSAKWLASRDNPLVARVTVNRWWAELFGQGIVSTLEDFGIKGAPPSHPELLDWLAVEFMESGWDMKHVLKLIVMSAKAYRPVVRSIVLTKSDKSTRQHFVWPTARVSASMPKPSATTPSPSPDCSARSKAACPSVRHSRTASGQKVGGQQYTTSSARRRNSLPPRPLRRAGSAARPIRAS